MIIYDRAKGSNRRTGTGKTSITKSGLPRVVRHGNMMLVEATGPEVKLPVRCQQRGKDGPGRSLPRLPNGVIRLCLLGGSKAHTAGDP